MRINKKTLVFIGLLIFLALILLTLKILLGKNQPTLPSPVEKPTPTVKTSPTPFYLCSPDESTRNKLPIVTENYTIEYFPVPKKFFVMILTNPYKKYKDEAEKWLTSYGIDPNGPCVFWTSAKGVAPKTQ